MRTLFVAAATLILLTSHPTDALGQQSVRPRIGTPSDTVRVRSVPGPFVWGIQSVPVWTPESVIGGLAAVQLAGESPVRCPMPTNARGEESRDPMPVFRPDTTTTVRMPIARSTCTNPMAPRVKP